MSLLCYLSSFCSENNSCESIFNEFLKLKKLDSNQRCTLLERLSNLLKDSRYTTKIADHFRHILLILLTSAIPIYDGSICTLQLLECNHQTNCVILGKLIGSYPDVLGFTLHYFEKLPAPFSYIEGNATAQINQVNEPMDTDPITDYDIVSATYNILKANPHHFKRKWNWSECYSFLTHSDDKVKWMAWNCIAIVLDMSESLRLKYVSSLIDSTVIDEFIINYKKQCTNFYSALSENPSEEIDLILEEIPSVISVSGVLLPVLNSNAEKLKFSLVPVPSMKENLRSLALAVATGKCVCVQGTVGCGKTSIIEYIANVTGRGQSDFIRVQLGDQVDSKVMLGTYRCTEIPGEFIWLPGILTKAVTDGKWLLLEDIDSATMDVSSTLSDLLETGRLSVPGHRDLIQVKSGFQLFITQRLFSSTTGLRKPVSNASNMLSKHWTCVNMEPLLKGELVTIVETLFPKLRTIASKMVDVFLIFQSSEESDMELKNISSKCRRLTSTRDLIKWCLRAAVYYVYPTTEEKKQNLFEDAIDIFCCSTPDEGKRQSLVIAIGHKLGINKVNAENIFQTYKPPITCEKDFIVGRAKLPCKTASYASIEKRNVTFSFTRPSACLLERIACCVTQKEPVLLVGETGTGKTSSIQYLAKSTGNTLIVINMNQLSESADLLGGYKPVDLKFLIKPIREEFELLFRSYFAVEPNKKYLEAIAFCYNQEKWDSLLKAMTVSANRAINRLKDSSKVKTWEKLLLKIEKLSTQVKGNIALGFAFVEGSLVKAIQKGYWVLLDEINLANAETLEYLSGLLEGSSGSLSLLERGDEDLIKRHPDFTLFACMNPATDVGKKELPIGFRNRFTEFFVDELTSKIDLQILVDSYLKHMNLQCKHEAIVNFYISLRKEAHLILFDGTMNKPHYSLRTLCRALSITAANPCEYELRSLFEAFCLSFLTQLDHKSYPIVEHLIKKSMLDEKLAKRILSSPISRPKNDLEYINFEGYWITRGSEAPKTPENYILTVSVRRNLKDIARAVSIGKMPILLQGDTSVGKTSLITYLAKASGHVCVRINNHEHTDLQEYVGSYVADEMGKLVFREGILVEAMRKGYWIILDELNLAPSDVLEALNRVLDDNRELFISETQQVVRAHNEFMLFATQNPPGLYGGRKVLSRAFRNRFVEFHFDEIPPIELQEILQKRCSMPESYCKQIINLMKDLQVRRKTTAAFAGKKGFITLRDLFRWGERYRLAPESGEGLYDWSQHLADEGYLVLAAKVRLPKEEAEIREVIKKHLKRNVRPQDLFTLSETTSPVTRHILEEILREDISEFKHIVWTYHLRRMAVLLRKSSQFREPVLLVGETGCGKTTVCQLVAAIQRQKLHVVNCHMHTESSDFLGNLRPVRVSQSENQKLFEWVDGPLIHAMRNGDLFLADEISLADDSVLERLNSLLEPERTLVLAEKGIDLTNPDKLGSIVVAKEEFLFVGTMNPGGDYGKKELSPALRNRFTEIWCDPCTEQDDLRIIIKHNLDVSLTERGGDISSCILNFIDWMKRYDVLKTFMVSTRDLLSWVDFINISTKSKLSLADAILQGACLTYIDGLGTNTENLKQFKENALEFLIRHLRSLGTFSIEKLTEVENLKISTEKIFGIEPFFIERGDDCEVNDERFTFSSSTTKLNTFKLLRAMQIKKPILLEGSPGVGKTSLVSAVAMASGHSLFRINLSDQTDVCDLFGTDLPVEGGKGGEFSWRDGPFLRALRAGHWILLDELNLASPSVLECLNACFDHRGELFIPELAKTFTITSETKFFACQNPMKQGGARRGLPKSFLNRFTQVFVSTLTDEDLKFISYSQFPELSQELVHRMVDFNTRVSSEAGVLWGLNGSPWEMNLRDVIRWCEATIYSAKCQCDESDLIYNPGCCVELIYADRMRTKIDKETVIKIYEEIFPVNRYPLSSSQPILHVTSDKLYFGDIVLNRSKSLFYEEDLLLLRDQMKVLRSLAQCINMKWMSILVGGPASGKSSIVRVISQLAGQKLKTVVVNSEMDTNEILGGFEQTDYNRHLEELFERTESLMIDCLKMRISKYNIETCRHYHHCLESVRNIIQNCKSTSSQLFLQKLNALLRLVIIMKSLDIHLEELNDISQKLESLSRIVEQERCLNAGGKFEWVDSLLVKCLQEGSWLLVDQVNFCSPALLDRLNGLLEPNGVLTIGERGTTIDGNIMTIKPHENFRLFLTMDPKYGEISRAMRNRGVEIFLLDQDQSFNKDLDVRSLLFNSGLTNKKYQDVLLEIHEKISHDISTTETLNITLLLKSAFLIKQQISRGFSLKQAIETSCQDVYIKARAISKEKNRLELLIQETITHFCNAIDIDETSINLETITWKVEDSQENSKLSRIKQQGVLLSYFIENIQFLQSSNLNDLAVFLNLDRFEELKNMTINEILPYVLMEFFEKSSVDDVELRNKWLLKNYNEANAICENLVKEILSFQFQCPNYSLPWDALYLPRALTKEAKEKTHYDANRLALLLYWNKIENDLLMRQLSKKETVRRYSTEVMNGTINILFKDESLINNFTPFTNQIRKFFNIILREPLTLNTTDYFKIRRNLQWYQRYCDLGNLVFEIDKKRTTEFINLSKISLLLKVHYKWLIKFLKVFISTLSNKFLSENCKTEIKNLSKMIDNTNKELFVLYNPVFKLAKKFKAAMCLPLPLSSKIIADSFSKLLYMTNCLNPWKNCNNEENMISNLIILISQDGLDARQQLLSHWQMFFKTHCFNEETKEHLLKIKEFCVKNNLILEHSNPINESKPEDLLNQTELAEFSKNIQLWPLYEYMFLQMANRIQQETCAAVYGNCQSVNITTQLWQKWTQVLSIPVNVLAISNAILLINQEPEKICRLLPVLSYLLKRFTRGNYALNDFKRLSNSNGLSTQQTENYNSFTSDSQMEEKSRSTPALLNLILELLLNKSQTKNETSVLSMPSLGAHESRINQLKKLNILLWRNSVSFNCLKFDSLLNDQKMLFTCGDYFLTLSQKLQLAEQLNLCDKEKNLLSEFNEILKELKIEPETEHKIFKRGKAWALFGYVQTSLFTSLGYVDPLYKIERKLEYAEEDIKDLKCTFYTKILESRIFGDKQIQNSHSRFMEIEPTINNILAEREILKTKKAYRPANTDFLILVKDFENLRNTLGSFHVIQNHVLELSKVFIDFMNNKNADIKTAERVVLRTETWQESLEQFIDRIESRFLSSYPDLILPAFAALSDMKHGIDMMKNHIQRLISKTLTNHQDATVEDLIEKMISFPTIYPQQSCLLDLVNFCTLDSTRELINKNLQTDSFREQFKITLSGLHELNNYILLNGTLSKSLWIKLSEIMHQIILIWKQQEKEILKREIEKESVYKNRSQIHGSQMKEEEEIKLELENLFPTYKDKDFNDFGIDAQEEFIEVRTKERSPVLLSVNDIQEVNRLYSNILIFCTTSNWLKNSLQCKTPDYVNPLLIRYNTVGLLLDNVTASLSSKISQKLYSSLNYLTHTTLSISQGKKLLNQKTSFDFYKDSNIAEVTLCVSLLRNVFDKISLLLNEWPEHPTLRAIRTVIKRILEFPITSSISRFLTGLELLLVKMKEWEENAHKDVSLFEHMSLLTQQIISWRKLELSSWKDCLNVTFQRLQSQSAKWCFWLYILLESYITKTYNPDEVDYFDDQNVVNEELSPEKLIEVLHYFISKSPLVEFEARLELLLTFHCHAFHFNSSPERDDVLSITWNVYNYYKQFTNDVNTKINSIRNPIEKKLKDFVKITRWNDISYWAVKETIAKSHKTLHKFIKEYEKELKENVTNCLVVKSTNGVINNVLKDKHEINSDVFILPTELINHKILPRDLLDKIKTEIVTSKYSEIRLNLENLVEDYMERSANLKKLEIDNTLPKPKQISHAKSVLQQKKKALSDYFKTIAHLGISYRIGILAWKNKRDTVIDLMISPVDLNAALRNFTSDADKSMIEQWNGCENYYQKAIAEFIALTQILSNAHKDLNPLNVERFKGYSAHMLLMANEQKRTLVREIKYFVALRSQIASLKVKDNLPKQQDLFKIAKSFKELLIFLQSNLEQLQLYLNACPSKSDIEENEPYDLEEITLPILYNTKEDSNINSVIENYSNLVKTISNQFNKIFHNIYNCEEFVPILTMEHFNYLTKSYKSLENLQIKLTEIEKAFGNFNHPLFKNIKYINKRISNNLQELNEFENKSSVQQMESFDKNSFEKMLTDVFLIVLNKLEEENQENVISFSTNELLDQKNIFSEMLKSLKYKITEMNLEDIFTNFNKLILMIHNSDTVHANLYFQMIKKYLPLLEQYLLYTQFYLNEQIASLRLTSKMLHLQLNVFLDLATNGFCIPKNLDLDIDPNGEEGSQENTGKGGMGLSNEEGVQDVSDRIESEDQLEEAKSKDQEEQDMDNKSCPEEEKGIDMSEDFEGKLQDIEKGENDNENSDNDDDDDGDLDKEMGETNEGENQQDKELWSDDEKEENKNEENLNEDDNAGKGEELDDETMGAKNNDEALSKESKEYKEKEEISELNEPDINDDQIDPYHGNQQPEIEPDALDLPDDINLDNEDNEAVDQEKQEEDLFDIDNMKEPVLPPDDEAKEDIEDVTKEDTENNERDEVESDPEDEPSDKNIEAAPMESEVPAEDSEVAAEENDSENQVNINDFDGKAENGMQVDVETEGTQNSVNQENEEKKSQRENIQNSQNDYGTGESHQGSGKTETALDEGGAQTDKRNNEENKSKKRKSLKEMDNKNMSLMEENEPMMKKTKTNIQERQNEHEDLDDKELNDETNETKETNFRHVDSKETYNRCAVDAATEDQVKKQATKITMDAENEENEEPIDINMLHEDEIIEEKTNHIQKPEQVSTSEDKSKGNSSSAAKNEIEQMEVDSDLPIVETTTVARGADSAFFTNLANLSLENVSNLEVFERTRDEVKQVLAHWRTEPSTQEAITTWNAVSSITDTAARELAEKLRLVLEPTHASRLKGDYKTGKRINMRKIIPYIASQFRKDKIWLRRTKPSKRNYQIVLAIDDSSSMVDNDSKEIAFESLSLISKAMTYLEAGELGVISFGEDINVLHPLGEVFTQESGARLMQKMRFEQTKTKVPQLVDYSIDIFNTQNDSVENAKLLVILSDGRGIFSEGKNRMNYAVRRARLSGVFTIFIVIDNQKNKESILDIRMPIAKIGQPLVIQSYMEHFPFPFYMILRDIKALPDILSDALRQWFELIGNMDN